MFCRFRSHNCSPDSNRYAGSNGGVDTRANRDKDSAACAIGDAGNCADANRKTIAQTNLHPAAGDARATDRRAEGCANAHRRAARNANSASSRTFSNAE